MCCKHEAIAMAKGFTLLELLIVLSILCVCLHFALPHFSQYLVRVRRSEAQTSLFELAQHLEFYYQKHHTYATATLATGKASDIKNTDITPAGWYRLSIQHQTSHTYRIQATPQQQQANQDLACQSFILTQSGEKNIAGGPAGAPRATASECWNF